MIRKKIIGIIFKLSIINIIYCMSITPIYALPIPGIDAITLSSCTGTESNPLCVAIPAKFMETVSDGIFKFDKDMKWKKEFIQSIPSNAHLQGISCTGHPPKATCVIVGSWVEKKAGEKIIHPLIVQSIDSGNTWDTQIVKDADKFAFRDVSCAASKHSVTCAAISRDGILVYTKNNGKTWEIPTIKNIPLDRVFNKVSCAGNKSKVFCAIVGYDTNLDLPLIVQNHDNDWFTSSINFAVPLGVGNRLNDVSCSEKESKIFCVAVGNIDRDYGIGKPLVLHNANMKKLWTMKINAAIPAGKRSSVDLISSSCISSGICVIAGIYFVDYVLKIKVAQSRDRGQTWKHVTFPDGSFNTLHCKQGDTHNLCLIGSQDNYTLYRSIDGGLNWDDVKINGRGIGQLTSLSCTSGNRPICVGVGTGSNDALLLHSIDGGKNWEVIADDAVAKSTSATRST